MGVSVHTHVHTHNTSNSDQPYPLPTRQQISQYCLGTGILVKFGQHKKIH